MPIRSGILSLGLVAIPVKVHPAAKDQTVHFNLLHKKCGSRVQNQWFCPVDNEVVSREELVRGAQVGKDKYVQITDEELEALEAEANRSIDLKEFVPLESVDPVYFENSYYLGPDKGGEKPYRLLADALAKMKRVAVAQLVSSGKEHLRNGAPVDAAGKRQAMLEQYRGYWISGTAGLVHPFSAESYPAGKIYKPARAVRSKRLPLRIALVQDDRSGSGRVFWP